MNKLPTMSDGHDNYRSYRKDVSFKKNEDTPRLENRPAVVERLRVGANLAVYSLHTEVMYEKSDADGIWKYLDKAHFVKKANVMDAQLLIFWQFLEKRS